MEENKINNINDYLIYIKKSFSEWNLETLIKNEHTENIKQITFILGNTSCDLDSFLSSLLLSIFRNFFKDNNFILKANKTIYIPLFNCNRADFCDRIDICYLMQKYNVNIENLIFVDDLIIKNEFKLYQFLDNSQEDLFKLGKIYITNLNKI